MISSNTEKVQKLMVAEEGVPPIGAPSRPSMLGQFMSCYRRSLLSYWRQPNYNLVGRKDLSFPTFTTL